LPELIEAIAWMMAMSRIERNPFSGFHAEKREGVTAGGFHVSLFRRRLL
jgi:hypothetical protein